MKNIKEFIELIERYETITLDEIKNEWNVAEYKSGHSVANALTGFGTTGTCTLCNAIQRKCTDCVYGTSDDIIELLFGCINMKNRPTYDKIDNSKTPEELLEAFRKRAKHMRKILQKNNKRQL